MPIPSQTFSNITPQLLNYINTQIIPNGMQEIDGDALNNALNGLANFIIEYAINGELTTIDSSSGSVVVVSKPITVFTGAPTSVEWGDNFQNEYYFVNGTGFDIPLTSGYSYTDAYENIQVIIPARQAVHISKTTNGDWVQINNLGGSGGSGDLPPQSGNAGKSLSTNGTTTMWNPTQISITSADFVVASVPNATICPIPEAEFNTLSIFWSDLGNFIYESSAQWQPYAGGGFEILMPGFDATANDYKLEVWLKPL